MQPSLVGTLKKKATGHRLPVTMVPFCLMPPLPRKGIRGSGRIMQRLLEGQQEPLGW